MTDHKVSRTGDGLVFKEYRPNAGDVANREWRARLLTARRGLVIMWFSMLFPGQGADVRNPPGTLRKQAVRTLELLNA